MFVKIDPDETCKSAWTLAIHARLLLWKAGHGFEGRSFTNRSGLGVFPPSQVRGSTGSQKTRRAWLSPSHMSYRLALTLHAPAHSRLSSRLRIAPSMPSPTHTTAGSKREPAAQYHPNNPEVAGSLDWPQGRRVQPPLPKQPTEAP
jgi:hypothetical protein